MELITQHQRSEHCWPTLKVLFRVLFCLVFLGGVLAEDAHGHIEEYINRIIEEKEATYADEIKRLKDVVLSQSKRSEEQMGHMQASFAHSEKAFGRKIKQMQASFAHSEKAFERKIEQMQASMNRSEETFERRLHQMKVEMNQQQKYSASNMQKLSNVVSKCTTPTPSQASGNKPTESASGDQLSKEPTTANTQAGEHYPESSAIWPASEVESRVNGEDSSLKAGSNVAPSHPESGSAIQIEETEHKRLLSSASGIQREHKVAFFAYLSQTVGNLGENQDIAFDHVVTNVGNAYNAHHGTFVAPVAGVYAFSGTIRAAAAAKTWGHFVVNGVVVAKFDDNHSEQVTQNIVVHLAVGDDVSIQNTSNGGGALGEGGYSTFSGYILYPDSEDPVTVG